MRTTKSVAFASWMLVHLPLGSHNEALAGDLLEAFHSGRSAMWYRRQVLAAIAIGAIDATHASAVILAFSATWTMLYPAWRLIVSDVMGHSLPDRWLLLAWPYSSLAQIGYGVVPANGSLALCQLKEASHTLVLKAGKHAHAMGVRPLRIGGVKRESEACQVFSIEGSKHMADIPAGDHENSA